MTVKEPIVGIIMGSDSDLDTMLPASQILNEFDISHEVRIVSAHRTPHWLSDYASKAVECGIRVIIAGAGGGAAHLPGMVASFAPVIPVIGVPVMKIGAPLDPLPSIVGMPNGEPVLTVGHNQAKNAALGALQILAVADQSLRRRLHVHYQQVTEDVIAKDEELQRIGAELYLTQMT